MHRQEMSRGRLPDELLRHTPCTYLRRKGCARHQKTFINVCLCTNVPTYLYLVVNHFLQPSPTAALGAWWGSLSTTVSEV